MCVSGCFEVGGDQRPPSIRSPVPQSRMNCVPSGAVRSRQGVFPPYRQVAGSTVGVEPRTPQKLSFVTGSLIAPSTALVLGTAETLRARPREPFFDTRSGGGDRQSIRGADVSNCPIRLQEGAPSGSLRVQ